MSGIFPMSAQIPPQEPEPTEQDEAGRYFDDMEQIRTHRGPALSAYQKHLDEIPTREKNKSGWGRKIAAGIIGGAQGLQQGFQAGAETGRRIAEAPYENALGEWSNKSKSLGASAALEREEVEDQLKALSSARALGLKHDEFKLKRLESDRDYDVNATNAETRSRIADLTEQRDRAVDARERRRIDNEIERATRQLDVNEFTAQTGRINAGTNARNVGSQIEDRNEGRVIDRERIAASIANSIRRADGSKASPDEQFDALDNAMVLLRGDPRFRKYITEDEGKRSMTEDDGSPMYAEFKRRLKAAAESSLKGSMFGGDEEENEDDDIDIFEEP